MRMETRRWSSGRRLFLAAALAMGAVGVVPSFALSPETDKPKPPVHAIQLPRGYRDWKLVSVAHEAGKLNDLRAVLGNDKALRAYRSSRQTLPEGSAIARLAWVYTPSARNDAAFGQQQSFTAGEPTNVQIMVKDSRKYAATGGWGYAQLTQGKPDKIDVEACHNCHQGARETDFVFTQYAK